MYKNFIKPIFDFILALLLIILLSPIFLILIILIRLKLGKGVFFIQKRPGLNGKIFKIYKFRTMDDRRDKNGRLLSDKERLVGFGRVIRSLSLDELPQLFNVLRGDMSFIGPRPLLVEYLPLYNKYQRKRHDVKPGITGWAQANGRNAISWDEKFKLDVFYVKNQSFLLDMKIFYLTFLKVIKKDGINSSQDVIMKKFTGNNKELSNGAL
ncbi:MAG: lipid carrier--UDP-N-acetylgalactosaminyltransferase [Proteobacteria bacterium]|nr:MAG: lipid carrier--UDP-N-acetylgalactosaminyltransferase [Pseudomonadota bacterium]